MTSCFAASASDRDGPRLADLWRVAAAASLVALLCAPNPSHAAEPPAVGMPAAATQNSATPTVLVAPEPVSRSTDPGPSVGRVFAEVGGALAGAVVLGVGAGLATEAIFQDGSGTYFGVLGVLVGLPTGVVIAGDLMGGDGSWRWTAGGFVAGGIVGGAVASAGTEAGAIAPLFLLTGGILGYELSAANRAGRIGSDAAKRRVSMSLSPLGDGGLWSLSGAW